MRSIVIFRFFSHLPLLFVYQCITFLPLIFRFSLYINDSLQEKVCFFKLVPEEVVVLREFEFRQVILGDDLRTNNIQSCKQPATAGGFLVRDPFTVHFV